MAALASEQLPERRALLLAVRIGLRVLALAVTALESNQVVDFGLVLGTAGV